MGACVRARTGKPKFCQSTSSHPAAQAGEFQSTGSCLLCLLCLPTETATPPMSPSTSPRLGHGQAARSLAPHLKQSTARVRPQASWSPPLAPSACAGWDDDGPLAAVLVRREASGDALGSLSVDCCTSFCSVVSCSSGSSSSRGQTGW